MIKEKSVIRIILHDMLLIYNIVYPHNFGKLPIIAKPFDFIQNIPEYHIASNRQKSNKEQVSDNK